MADHSASSTTDSPWFWLAVFLIAAVAALILAAPKYSWRQPQLERQYQARERSGMTISAADESASLSRPGEPVIALRPLQWLFTMALLVSCIVFWMLRWRNRFYHQRSITLNDGG